jgi:hypothetical protein
MGQRPRGALPGWRPTTDRQKAILADLTARYEQHHRDGTLPRGPNGAFYDLRPAGMGNGITRYFKPAKGEGWGPTEATAAHVQEVLVLARRAGIIDEDWVADGRAVPGSVPYYDEGAEKEAEFLVGRLSEATVDLDPQTHQPVYIESLCEAADLVPRLDRVANPLGVPVYPGSGFDGLKAKRAMGERAAERDKPTVVLHIGDRNKQGEDIYFAAAEDAVGWCEEEGEDGEVKPLDFDLDDLKELRNPDAWLTFVRLGVSTAQAKALKLLDDDGKAEADAVPVKVMDGWLTDAIEALQDAACRERLLAEEAAERERLPDAIRRELDKRTA